MPCYHPIPGWYAVKRNESGKRSIVFSTVDGYKDKPLQVPCGTCVGCKLERARQWALRCMHEAKMHEETCFITLTYNDENLPPNGSLVPEHFVNFMKRLRFKYGEGIRFFHCGEYGERLGRPHHHAILFGLDFPDKRSHSASGDNILYTSESLDKLWGYGFCSIGACTFESAGYVARYTLKKVVGPGAAAHYGGRVPEYLTMSRRPGIGRSFVDKFGAEIYRSDSVIVNGAECKPPRYYDNVAEKARPTVLKRVKARRRAAAAASPDNTGKRLIVREVVKQAAITSLRRD